MILDALTRLTTSQAVTTGGEYTDYSYDLHNVTPKNDIGAGEPMAIVFTVNVAVAGGTDTTHFVAVQATSADLATGTIRVADRLVANALLTAGAKIILPIPPNSTPLRYIGGLVEVGAADSITVTADLVPMSFVENLRTYADGILIS